MLCRLQYKDRVCSYPTLPSPPRVPHVGSWLCLCSMFLWPKQFLTRGVSPAFRAGGAASGSEPKGRRGVVWRPKPRSRDRQTRARLTVHGPKLDLKPGSPPGCSPSPATSLGGRGLGVQGTAWPMDEGTGELSSQGPSRQGGWEYRVHGAANSLRAGNALPPASCFHASVGLGEGGGSGNSSAWRLRPPSLWGLWRSRSPPLPYALSLGACTRACYLNTLPLGVTVLPSCPNAAHQLGAMTASLGENFCPLPYPSRRAGQGPEQSEGHRAGCPEGGVAYEQVWPD